MAAMSSGSNPFEGMPFFGDLLKMLGSQGAVQWDGARQLALSIATGGESEPNVDPLERVRYEQLARVAERVAHGVNLLSSMDNAQAILAVCREIDHYENEADEVLRTAMSKLFREEQDVRELIKLKGIYERLESVTDYCDNVGNLLQAIVLENS